MFGVVPAYGLYVRHADDVILENVYFGIYAVIVHLKTSHLFALQNRPL